jgi:hypothetical protein
VNREVETETNQVNREVETETNVVGTESPPPPKVEFPSPSETYEIPLPSSTPNNNSIVVPTNTASSNPVNPPQSPNPPFEQPIKETETDTNINAPPPPESSEQKIRNMSHSNIHTQTLINILSLLYRIDFRNNNIFDVVDSVFLDSGFVITYRNDLLLLS